MAKKKKSKLDEVFKDKAQAKKSSMLKKQTGVLGYRKGSLADIILTACFEDKPMANIVKIVAGEIKKRDGKLVYKPKQYISYVLNQAKQKNLTKKQAQQVEQLAKS